MKKLAFLCLGLLMSTSAFSRSFGAFVFETLEPGQKVVLHSSEESWYCGWAVTSISAEVEYNGALWGDFGLVINGRVADTNSVDPNQGHVRVRPFSAFDHLCDDIQELAIQNVGYEPLWVGNVTVFLGDRSRDLH